MWKYPGVKAVMPGCVAVVMLVVYKPSNIPTLTIDFIFMASFFWNYQAQIT